MFAGGFLLYFNARYSGWCCLKRTFFGWEWIEEFPKDLIKQLNLKKAVWSCKSWGLFIQRRFRKFSDEASHN